MDRSLTFVLDITQLVNICHNSQVGFQESVSHSQAPQYWEPRCTNLPDHTHVFNNLASPRGTDTPPCPCLPSPTWNDSVPHNQHHSYSDDVISGAHLRLPLYPGSPPVSAAPSPTPLAQHSDDAISESQFLSALPPYPYSLQQRILTVYGQLESQADSQQQQQENQDQPPLEVPAPTTPPSGPSFPALDSMPPQDLVGRRAPAPAPKWRHITRAVLLRWP